MGIVRIDLPVYRSIGIDTVEFITSFDKFKSFNSTVYGSKLAFSVDFEDVEFDDLKTLQGIIRRSNLGTRYFLNISNPLEPELRKREEYVYINSSSSIKGCVNSFLKYLRIYDFNIIPFYDRDNFSKDLVSTGEYIGVGFEELNVFYKKFIIDDIKHFPQFAEIRTFDLE